MADSVVTNVTTLDIQMLDAERKNATTIKLDFPKDNLTREQVSAAMQPAFANGWLLTNAGSVAMYLGDVTINQSIKTKLDGEDFYVTPAAINTNVTGYVTYETTVTVSGATIQGTNITNINLDNVQENEIEIYSPKIAENGLSVEIKINLEKITGRRFTINFDIELVILGTIVTVPLEILSA